MKIQALLLIIFIPLVLSAQERREPASFYEKKFSINFRSTPARQALELIATKGDLDLRLENSLTGKVTYNMKDATLEEALEYLAEELGVEYRVRGKVLFVGKRDRGGARAPASAPVAGAPTAPSAPNTNAASDVDLFGLTYRSVSLSFAQAKDLVPVATRILGREEMVVQDDINNALILYSGEKTYEKIKALAAVYDKRPSQIMIEAQIVETTRNFARSLGINWGDSGISSGTTPSFGYGTTNNIKGSPNLVLRTLLGTVDGRMLEARLMAGESEGEAKIVSRPKIFTLNNRKAQIQSGASYYVKTVAVVTGGATGGAGGGTGGGGGSTPGGGGASTAGGVQQISSGLQFDVTPSIVGKDLVRLIISVQNSTQQEGASVDGIPGSNNNSAETAIIVKAGQTATMAGLARQEASKDQMGAPWLSKLPVIGWLFQAKSDRNLNTEMMIFITPHIVDPVGDQAAEAPKTASAEAAPQPAPKQ